MEDNYGMNLGGTMTDSSALGAGERDLRSAVQDPPWDYLDANTKELTHGIHRYSGKFIPQIASRAIELLTEPGELVLDPYCGSGTTVLEALRLRRRAVGTDINPLALLIARAKVTPVPASTLRDATRRLSQAVDAAERGDDGTLFGLSAHQRAVLACAGRDQRLHNAVFGKWFQPQVLRDLCVIRAAIDQLPEEATQRAALVAFSEVLRKSSNAHTGYPNVTFDKKAPQRARPGRAFLKSLDRTFAAVGTLEGCDLKWSEASVVEANAEALPLASESVDAVVTHPPYIGAVPYAEYGRLSLLWLGADHKDLDRRLTGGRRQSKDVVTRFTRAYGNMLRESFRVLKPGRRAFVMVGNPTVRGEVVDLAEMTEDLATTAGFKIAARTTRGSVNRRANKMGDEYLIFLERPAAP